MISPFHKEFLSNSLAMWIGTADLNNIPDTVRCLGVDVVDETTIKVYVAEKFSEKLFKNLSKNPQLAFATSHPMTFIGYQYKGDVIKISPCTPEEIKSQTHYMDLFASGMASFGLHKQSVFDMYFYQPSMALWVKVNHIYDQTPKQNTGEEVTL